MKETCVVKTVHETASLLRLIVAQSAGFGAVKISFLRASSFLAFAVFFLRFLGLWPNARFFPYILYIY
jgi:hypothetical protein